MEEEETVRRKLERENNEMRNRLETERNRLELEKSRLQVERKYEGEI